MTSDSRTIEQVADGDALDDLIRHAQAGEEWAFEALLDRLESKAILTARSMGASREDAEDIAQEAFLKVFRYIGSYRSERTFRAYFYRIVINASRDHLSRMRPTAQADLEAVAEPSSDAESRASYEEVEMLRRALAELPAREREVVILRDLQGLSTWDVARVLRISPITVRRHSSRALARLKKLMGPGGPLG